MSEQQNSYEIKEADVLKQESLQTKPLAARRIFTLPVGFKYRDEWIKEVEFRDLTLADKNIKYDDPRYETLVFRNIVRFGPFTNRIDIDKIMVYKLSNMDRIFCTIASRRTTHGDLYYTKSQCVKKEENELEVDEQNGCGTKTRELKINLGEFSFVEPNESKEKSTFTVELPLSEKEVIFERPTVHSENLSKAFIKSFIKEDELNKITTERERQQYALKHIGESNFLISRYIGIISKIGDKVFDIEKMTLNSKDFQDFKNQLLILPTQDFEDLQNTVAYFNPAPDLSVEFTCEKCGKECKEQFEFDPLFFTSKEKKVLKIK